MDLSVAEWALLATFACAGGFAQGGVGMGFAIVLAPVVSIVEPAAVPVTVLLVAMPLSVLVARRERAHIDVRGVVLLSFGRVPGSVIGVVLVLVLAGDALTVMVGCVIVLGALASAVTRPVPVNTGTLLAAGVVSGLTGTATSVAGPPLGLLYQHHPPPVVRSTLAVAFGIGLVVSLIALGLAGELAWWKLRWALTLLPAMLVGYGLSALLARRADAPWFRPAVLAIAAAAGSAAIVRGLL